MSTKTRLETKSQKSPSKESSQNLLVIRRINISRYRKLLNKYLTIRANNQTLRQTYDLAVSTASQLSNQNAYPALPTLTNGRHILDSIIALNPATLPLSPPSEDEDVHPPSPATFDRDAHFGYTPSPSPSPEAATQLTREQIDMGMFKGHSASALDMMGPQQSIEREDLRADAFKSRSATGGGSSAGTRRGGSRGAGLMVPSTMRRKRKDRENEVNEGAVTASQKMSRR